MQKGFGGFIFDPKQGETMLVFSIRHILILLVPVAVVAVIVAIIVLSQRGR